MVQKDDWAQPFLKWAGGKRQLLPEIRKYIPEKFNTYYEPFVGAGAVLFDIQPKKAVINDINLDLINTYRTISAHVDELINDLKKHKNEKDYFYTIRDLDRQDVFTHMSPIEKSSRLIYLNKTCYNGLFRVNSRGQFNVPFGKYKNPQIINERVIRAVHDYLASSEITFLCEDFESVAAQAEANDFVYFDPPYDPVSCTSSFTGYSLGGFDREKQVKLRDTAVHLNEKGCKVLLSNSATDFIREIYGAKGFHIETVSATRSINSISAKRGRIDEVLVMNY